MSPHTGKKVKPNNNNAACDHLLHCNYLHTFVNCSIWNHANKSFLLEIKESLIMRDNSKYRNISSGPLNLFDKVS